jgi:hypothetical protein
MCHINDEMYQKYKLSKYNTEINPAKSKCTTNLNITAKGEPSRNCIISSRLAFGPFLPKTH